MIQQELPASINAVPKEKVEGLTKVKRDFAQHRYFASDLRSKPPRREVIAAIVEYIRRSSKMIGVRFTTLAICCTTWMTSALSQDLDAGANSFKKCAICHDLGEGAKNKVGPVLNGLAGRKTGTVAAYNYSEANKNSGIVWNEETFLEYIKDPKAKIPGTKMIFPGIKNESEAKNLWAYLSQFAGDGKKK